MRVKISPYRVGGLLSTAALVLTVSTILTPTATIATPTPADFLVISDTFADLPGAYTLGWDRAFAAANTTYNTLDPDQLSSSVLSSYKAVITTGRLGPSSEAVQECFDMLDDYVKAGGLLVTDSPGPEAIEGVNCRFEKSVGEYGGTEPVDLVIDVDHAITKGLVGQKLDFGPGSVGIVSFPPGAVVD